jgi:hypothetical protein
MKIAERRDRGHPYLMASHEHVTRRQPARPEPGNLGTKCLLRVPLSSVNFVLARETICTAPTGKSSGYAMCKDDDETSTAVKQAARTKSSDHNGNLLALIERWLSPADRVDSIIRRCIFGRIAFGVTTGMSSDVLIIENESARRGRHRAVRVG